MRDAETTLLIIEDRGKKNLPLENVYRRLYNPDLYLRAYGRLYRTEGAMTQGTTEETVDGMSQEKILDIIEKLECERYRWTPVRRTYIEKKGSTKMRPLGIPTWTDKLLQEVMRSILEAYYEPQFSPSSHGFRPRRGCHTALKEIFHTWTGTRWFIEGDIKGCFDNIDHTVLLSIIREKIHDNRFLILVENLLKAGYLEKWDYRPTLSGTPQGGIITPPTMLQRTLLGASLKRGWTDPIHDADLLLVDLDLLHQSTKDLPSRVPVRLLQLLGNAFRELLQLADHQPQFHFLVGLVKPLPTLILQLGQALAPPRSSARIPTCRATRRRRHRSIVKSSSLDLQSSC